MNKETGIVVIKGDRVFTITIGRKLVRSLDQKAVEDINTGIDVSKLKDAYPHASIRKYSDSRLSNYYRAMVDRAAAN